MTDGVDGEFAWAVGIEDTFIGHPSGTRRRVLDEYELIDHYRRARSDLDLIAGLGVRVLRYGLPWYRLNPAPGRWDWTWADRVMAHMARRGLRPIVDLVHYGVPLWLTGAFANPDYAERVAEYGARAAERYGDLAFGWTPLNEPMITADWCGLRGLWPPHLHGERGYDRVLIGVADGIARTTAAIRAADARARIVAVEPYDVMTTDEPELESAVAAHRAKVLLPLDLVLGRVDGSHLARVRLEEAGAAPTLDRLVADPQPPDVVGVNFYPNMSRTTLATRRGAVRRRWIHGSGGDLVTALAAVHRHTGLPVMVTETSDAGDVARRAAWMDASASAVGGARDDGIPVLGLTWFPVLSHVDWRWRRGPHALDAYWTHMGLWDLDARLRRRRTPLVDRYAALVAAGAPGSAAAA